MSDASPDMKEKGFMCPGCWIRNAPLMSHCAACMNMCTYLPTKIMKGSFLESRQERQTINSFKWWLSGQ